jgi:hypothetical protein
MKCRSMASVSRSRSWRSFVEVLRIVDHNDGQDQDDGEPLDEGDEPSPADRWVSPRATKAVFGHM